MFSRLNFAKSLAAGVFLRRQLTALERIAAALDRQTLLLDRLTERFAPELPAEPAGDARRQLRADTGVSHVDPLEVALADDFIARSERDTGHTPDEDEILIHLGDERTRDLAERLAERDSELARLLEARR